MRIELLHKKASAKSLDKSLLKISTFVHTTKLIKMLSISTTGLNGLVKSRQKNWRESRSRETKVGEKIAVTNGYACTMKKAHYKFTKTGIIHTEGVSIALALPLW